MKEEVRRRSEREKFKEYILKMNGVDEKLAESRKSIKAGFFLL